LRIRISKISLFRWC